MHSIQVIIVRIISTILKYQYMQRLAIPKYITIIYQTQVTSRLKVAKYSQVFQDFSNFTQLHVQYTIRNKHWIRLWIFFRFFCYFYLLFICTTFAAYRFLVRLWKPPALHIWGFTRTKGFVCLSTFLAFFGGDFACFLFFFSFFFIYRTPWTPIQHLL